MKKILFGALAILSAATLMVGCEEKKEEPTVEPVVEVVENVEENVEETVAEPEEQIGVGNTDEGFVALQVEEYLKNSFSGEVEEVTFNNIKVYSQEEIAADESLKDLGLSERDIVFEIAYELKIADGVEDLMKYTAATGTVEGQMVKEKYNVGILKAQEDGSYKVEAFGTAF